MPAFAWISPHLPFHLLQKWDKLGLFLSEQSRDYILSKEEVGRLLEAADEKLRKIILVGLNTGLRKGEILGLRWGQVNFEDGVISFARTKSTKFHRVPMNSVVLSVLSSIEQKGDYVFPGRWGRGHLVDCKKEFEAARKGAGLPELHFHDLRHCAGTYMAAAGVPLTTVQQILGHKDIRTTARYINPNDENRRKAVNALATLFEEATVSKGQEETLIKARNAGADLKAAHIHRFFKSGWPPDIISDFLYVTTEDALDDLRKRENSKG